jgi:hypothetical protein
MSNGTIPYDFEGLTRLDNPSLKNILDGGAKPELRDLVGYDFRGFNLQSLTALIGTRKFKKGFYGDPQEGHIWGYNIRVVQDGVGVPWVALPSDDKPNRLAFFKVFPAEPTGRDADFAHTMVIDYSQWKDYFVLNPARYILDYLVLPDPANRDLLLGISYFAVGNIKTFAGYFVLERYNQNHYPT